ncbi:MAG: EAL domain-containing protein [Tatlockia sp.]|nr:EAL domain-containing protein [Tatlockia sp.]
MWKIPKAMIENKDYAIIEDNICSKLTAPDIFLKFIKYCKTSPDQSSEITLKLSDGRYIECYTQSHLLDGVNVGRVWSFRDITNHIVLEEKLAYQASHDPLTSLPNRALLLDRLQQEIAHAKRENQMFAVMFIDLDRFKLINDSLSHETGDELLLNISKRLSTITRAEDTIARLSGDEFILVSVSLPLHKEHHAIKIATKVLEVIRTVTKTSDREIIITASLGISIYPQDGATSVELLHNADLAMYRAKSLGGNQFQFYSEHLNDECKLRMEQETDMRRALIRNEFFLQYQPQFVSDNDKTIAVEALVRWNHPKRGVILPMDFIPLAEDTGMIVSLGEWVLKTACKQNKEWQNKGFKPFPISVNMATKQFMQPNIIEIIKGILHDTGLKAEYLEIEVTENVIISGRDVVNTIMELKQLGVRIVLDDFGTGNACLNYLRALPIDQIKIDKSFIDNIHTSSPDQVIIQAIIAMANSLLMEVLAEGVTNPEQLKFLEAQNCNKFQGYYFSKPVDADELEAFLIKCAPKKSNT